jgi:hypothetical protein
MRFTIGIKIFGIAIGLLILMAVVSLLSMRMTRTVDDQLVIIDRNYFPAYVALAQANIHSIEESAYVRRLLLAIAERPDNAAKVDDLRQRIASGKASDEQIAAARQHINEQIADPLTLTTTSLLRGSMSGSRRCRRNGGVMRLCWPNCWRPPRSTTRR